MGVPCFFFFFRPFIFFLIFELIVAADTITPTSILYDGEALISSGEIFELGFFSPGQSTKRYLGIWYKRIPETVVWVANRNNPLTDRQGVLTISNYGNLVLLNKTKSITWSSNTSRKVENPVAQLLDSGNLVLRDTSNTSLKWQSFDYPSDALLPGMKLGWDLKTGLERYLTSWKSADDPSYGDFTWRLDIRVLPHMVGYKGSMKIDRTGYWNGVDFGGVLHNPNMLFELILVHDKDKIYYEYESFNNPLIMLIRMNHSGYFQGLIWKDRESRWDIVFSTPRDPCGYYGKCSANSVCSTDKTPICDCLQGFIPKSQLNQISPTACVRSSSFNCESGVKFVKLEHRQPPDLLDVYLNKSMSLDECKNKCLKNCSCNAYANSNVGGGGRGCLMWYGALVDIRGKMDDVVWQQDIYVRVPASESDLSKGTPTDPEHKRNRRNTKQLWIIVVLTVTLTVVMLGLVMLWVRGKLTRKGGEDLLQFDSGRSPTADNLELTEDNKLGKSRINELKLPLFSFASVCAATNNFSAVNKLGEGGFGPVYKGTLLKGDEIAVKRLSKRSRQGWEELKSEAQLIANLQHKNLVRLFGCCIEKEEKILIYEYMPNKSLDFFLFDATNRMLLDWGTRVRIIGGIAQGLLYLHQYSRLRIIYRDLKTSNILLDIDMNSKISDFGIARIFGGNELQANTNHIVGTYGYMSPEYALEGLFSIKSDVFSFGVLLLEIVSGKKNTGFYQTTSLNLIGYAWDMWTSEKALDLKDQVLEVASSEHMFLRYVNIGLLCAQERAEDRPTMSDVVSMLINETASLPSPKQPAFSHIRSTVNSEPPISSSRPDNCSINNVTVSVLQAR